MIDKILGDNDDYKYGEKYKFKSLRVYCSTEWMYNATKKYRRVFDRDEVDYIRAELAFYNKLFDEKEWVGELRLKAFKIVAGVRKEICNQSQKTVIHPNENTIYFHKGWGTDKVGGFWKKGKYVWEAYIDDKFVGEEEFYIEEVGIVTPDCNPYFDIQSVKLFAGPYDGWSITDRNYLKQFDRKNTQYIWVEIKLINKVNTDWHCELFINHYNHAGQHKAQITSFRRIDKGKKDYVYTFEEGWGSREGGTWLDDKYTVEIVFMDTLVAILPFEVGDEEIEGTNELINPANYDNIAKTSIETKQQPEQSNEMETQSLNQVLEELDNLIGLQSIKTKIREHISYLDFLKLRQSKGFEDKEQINLHSVFTGNPGTGKTTIVKLLGKIYHKMGLLSKGHVHEVDRVDLVGEFIGQTAPKAKEAINEARGGVLFVDEAYSLARKDGDSKDFGREVIEVLVKEMSDGEGDLAIMFAGYPEEMNAMLNTNPGLRSRIKYYYHFEDYLPEELLRIAEYAAEMRSVALEEKAKQQLKSIIVEAYRNRDKTFGNARFAISLIDEGKMNLGLRIMKNPNARRLSKKTLSTITLDDINQLIDSKKKRRLDIEINENLLREALQELNALVGLSTIKNEVNELIKLVRYYRETGNDVLNKFSLHTVFVGNPGTGKTTVARIMGKIYKALGLLERGHVVECDREGLVAGYIGQTAIKTKERIEQARGGVLFIDEAYALAEGHQYSYGNEAIEVILKNMEDMRGEFSVIVAGYPHNMQQFLKSNPGLHSRFDRTFNFPDFSSDELYKIALHMLAEENLRPDEKAEKHLREYFVELYKKRDKYYGNARTIRKIVDEAVKNQNLRMALMSPEKRTSEMLSILTRDDVKEVIIEDIKQTSGIGFNR